MLRRRFNRGRRVWVRLTPSGTWTLANADGSSAELEVYEMADGFLRKRVKSEGGKGGTPYRGLTQDRERYPALIEFLTADVWPDGSPRRPGTLLAFSDEGRVKLCLADRDQDAVLFLTVDGLFVAFEAADDALRADSADWRPAKNNQARRYDKRGT